MSLKSEAIKRFLTAARSLANQGLSKEAITQFAKNEFGEITELFQKQIDNIFKRPASGIEKIKIKDEVFDDTVIKLPVDDTGQPFNPKDPLKDYSKKPRDEKYTGGLVDVEPSLSDIGHGSDALMARTRLMSPGSQATTSTGLNYLLAEDNDNIRVPFENGKNFEMYLKERGEIERKENFDRLYKEYLEDLRRNVVMKQKQMAAEGGRIGFSKGKLADKARRKFMKTVGTGAAGLAALKTGLINLAEQAGPKVEMVTETVKEYSAPALDKIVETVMSVGDLVSQSGRRLKELTTKKKFKDIEVEEDMMDGPSYIIKKDGETIYYKPGKQDEMGVEDDIIEVIEDTTTKKASGGRIGYSKGKLIKTLGSRTLAFLEKVFGKEAMAEMPKRDPDLYKGLLEVTEAYRARDKEGLKKYMKGFLPHMDEAELEEFIVGNPEIGDMSGVLLRLGSGRDYKAKIDMINEANKNRKLADLEVTEDMKRKPNASGGIAKLLGE